MYVPERSTYVERDNGIREDAGPETFRDVKPVFDRHHGSVTPANSSQITDAAAAMLLMEEEQGQVTWPADPRVREGLCRFWL